MTTQLKTPGIHHISLRCMDIPRTKSFYQELIGLPLLLDTAQLIIFGAGAVSIAFQQAKPAQKEGAVFNPFEIGLDHLALGCDSEEELRRFAKGLADAGVENTGVKTDETLNRLYIAFKDPDRIQWEFYMTQ